MKNDSVMLRKVLIAYKYKRRRGWSSERRRAMQGELLRKVVADAYGSVPFYRRWLDEAGVSIDMIETLDDLQKIPVVTKRDFALVDIKDRIKEGVDLEKCHSSQTSGSTGTPAKTYFSKDEYRDRRGRMHLGFADLGCKPYERVISLGKLINKPRREKFSFPSSIIKPAILKNFRNKLYSLRSSVVYGDQPTRTYQRALKHEKSGRSTYSPRMIVAAGDMMTASARKYIEGVYGCPFKFFYGTKEFGMIGTECPESESYHVTSDNIIIEVIKDGVRVADGEEGVMTLTDLTERVMPMIRYELGDIVTYSEDGCSCGHKGPVILSLKGRADDLIILPDGSAISAYFAVESIYDISTIIQFRIIQKSLEAFEIEYEGEIPEERKARIRAEYADKFSADNVTFRKVDHMSPDPSGKLRKFISHVKSTHDITPS